MINVAVKIIRIISKKRDLVKVTDVLLLNKIKILKHTIQ